LSQTFYIPVKIDMNQIVITGLRYANIEKIWLGTGLKIENVNNRSTL